MMRVFYNIQGTIYLDPAALVKMARDYQFSISEEDIRMPAGTAAGPWSNAQLIAV